MSKNETPFDDMLKRIQNISSKIASVQEKMRDLESKGSAGGGAVDVWSNAGGFCTKIAINDDSLLAAPDKKDVLIDLLMRAFNDSRNRLTEEMTKKMEALGIPREILEGNGDFSGLMGGMSDGDEGAK